MSDENDKQKIRDFLYMRYPSARQTVDSDDLLARGYIDSITMAELVTYLEKTFDVAITVDEMSFDNLRSVDAMTAMIGRLRTAQAGEVA